MMGGICAMADAARQKAHKEALAAGKSEAEADRAGKEAFDATFDDCSAEAGRQIRLFSRILGWFI